MSSRSSIFSFNTLRGLPSLKVFILTIVFLAAMMAVGKAAFFNKANEVTLIDAGEGIVAFERLDKNDISSLPHIIVAGDSRNGEGIIAGVLEDDLKLPIAKLTLNSSSIWEPYAILHSSPNNKMTKIVLFDIHPLQFVEGEGFLQGGNTFALLKNWNEQYPGYRNQNNYRQIKSILPARLSIFQMVNIISSMNNFNKEPYSWKKAVIKGKGTSVASLCTSQKLENSLLARQKFQFNDKLVLTLWQFVDECAKRNILVVINRVPTFEGRNFMPPGIGCGIPPELCNTEIDRKFEEVCQEIQKRDNVVFLGFRRFSDIGVMDDEEELFRDCHHLLPKGAEIYTKWLAEELMRNPKTRAALERE